MTTPTNSEDLRRTWRRDMSNGLEVINSTITGMVIGFQLVMIALRASRPRHKPHNHRCYGVYFLSDCSTFMSIEQEIAGFHITNYCDCQQVLKIKLTTWFWAIICPVKNGKGALLSRNQQEGSYSSQSFSHLFSLSICRWSMTASIWSIALDNSS